MLYAWRNPPPEFLEKEVALFPDWLVWHLLISPKLAVYAATVEPLGDALYKVRLVVQNTGWLPTYITKKALEKKLVRGVIAEIELPDGATLRSWASRARSWGNWKGAPTSPPPLMCGTPTRPTTARRWSGSCMRRRAARCA
jgi:hypothetical protein